MALPHAFAAVTSATGQQLDDDFNAVGALTTVFATASGTNNIVLTPAANAPACTAYGLPYPYRFSFVAAGTSSQAVTVAVNALAGLPLYLPTGVQANSADIQLGFYYEIAYVASLNSGSGGFQIASAIPTATATGIGVASASGLSIANNAVTPNTKIDITAAVAALVTSAGVPLRATSVAVTLDLTTNGVNGMDTGARPTSGFVYVYLISNGTLTRSLGTVTSPISGGPALPVGYAYSGYMGAMFCDASQNLKRSRQVGNQAQYIVVPATNTAVLPNMANGVAGTVSTTAPVFALIPVALFVPPTTSEIRIVVTNQYGASGGASVAVAPNASYSGVASNNPGLFYVALGIALAGSEQITFLLESTNIYWFSSGAGGGVNCMGWKDYYSAAA